MTDVRNGDTNIDAEANEALILDANVHDIHFYNLSCKARSTSMHICTSKQFARCSTYTDGAWSIPSFTFTFSFIPGVIYQGV